MIRNFAILGLLAIIVALPFVFQKPAGVSTWKDGDPVLVIISPMNEAIRHEFGAAFSDWRQARYGRPVKVDWRNIGGTTEIMRYLASEYTAAFRAWWKASGREWPDNGADILLDRKFDPNRPPADASAAEWAARKELWTAFRQTDDPKAFTSKIDLFFGGGAFDQDNAWRQGLTVAPWPADQPPAPLAFTEDGVDLFPRQMGGETWRTDVFFGTCLSTFGICYNTDRMADLGIRQAPARWADLAAPAWFGQLGAADPTKSGSIAKAFEMIVHEQCQRALVNAGFSEPQIEEFERRIQQARLAPGQMPEGVPADYQAALEAGWMNGVRLLQAIGANARYFTDAAGKVPMDVGMGSAAAGISIDFYGRCEAETTQGRGASTPMKYMTPAGGSSVSADPIALLRGAEHRELAVSFICFTLSEEGQRLWNYRPGTPGGPRKYALRRLPIRRDFYPSSHAALQARYERHKPFTSDSLGDPAVNPYELAEKFTYHPRWTAGHYGILRDLTRAMCLDAGEELRAAWKAILAAGGPEAQPEALRRLRQMPERPEPLNWTTALQMGKKYDRMELLKEWTLAFRKNYAEAKALAQPSTGAR